MECAPRSDVIRAVRGTVNSTSVSSTTGLVAPTSPAALGSSDEGLSVAEKAGVGIGASIGGVALLVVAFFFVLHKRRRRSTAAKPPALVECAGSTYQGSRGERTMVELDPQHGIAELAPQLEPIEMGALR